MLWRLIPFLCIAALWAKPHGCKLVSGEMTLESDQAEMVLRTGAKTILEWDGFSIDANEVVRFEQLHAASKVLNRVVSKEQSALLGQLLSNGSLYLINPNGVFIGPNARIEAASCIAATFDLLDADFLEGNLLFTGESTAPIIHQGLISAPSGKIVLLAHTIQCNGILDAPNGSIQVGFSPLAEHRSYECIMRPSGTLSATHVVEIGDRALLRADEGTVLCYGDEMHCTGKIEIGSGFAEVSGKKLDFRGTADARGKDGAYGTFLLDPTNITISGGVDAGGTFDSCDYAPSGSDNVINTTTLEGLLTNCNVTISTASGGPQEGTITVSSAFTWGAPTTLTLDANRNIAISANIANTSEVEGFTAMDFTARGETAGVFYQGIEILSSAEVTAMSGDILMNGTGGTITASSGIRVRGLNTRIASTSGAIILTGSRTATDNSISRGISVLDNAVVESTSGPIIFHGTASGGGISRGIILFSTGSLVQTTTGSITFTGIYNGDQPDGCGINPNFANSIITDSGLVTLNGTSTTSHGVFIPVTLDMLGGDLVFANCQGGSATSAHAINITGTLSVDGNITATNNLVGGTDADARGWSNTAAVTAGGDISIQATTLASNGAAPIFIDAPLTSTSGSITLGSPAELSATGTLNVARNLAVHSLSKPDALTLQPGPSGTLQFSGPSVTAPTISLAPNARTSYPQAATIFGNRDTGNDVTFTCTDFAMGPQEAMTGFGNVSIVASGTATVSDVVALGTLRIEAGSIVLQQRPEIELLAFTGQQYPSYFPHLVSREAPVVQGAISLGNGFVAEVSALRSHMLVLNPTLSFDPTLFIPQLTQEFLEANSEMSYSLPLFGRPWQWAYEPTLCRKGDEVCIEGRCFKFQSFLLENRVRW